MVVSLARLFTLFVAIVPSIHALGTSCSAPLGGGTAAAGAPYWLENMPKLGTSAFNSNPSSYVVRRNVKDYGAKGDGSTDDTAAIKCVPPARVFTHSLTLAPTSAAILAGGRCGNPNGCSESTVTPAVVYFPAG